MDNCRESLIGIQRGFQNRKHERRTKMKIYVCGPGCKRCTKTEQDVIDACVALNVAADIAHVFDLMKFACFSAR